ncbi:MAG TPA: arsenate reductase (glutaredoxin) [Vicinamibacterales bacterium]|jgi:arsenate reductase|nr:arsenate reductase (glutaredoxin) [Vicinamibacterales bacterium]
MSDITIYYNPFCEISRNALAVIRHAGIEPTIIEYLWTPPSRATLLELLAAMKTPVRSIVRVHSPYGADLGLFDPAWTDDMMLELVVERPIFLNRPIVVTPLGAKVCRPSETLLELLPVPTLSPFIKEDGSVVVR